MLDIDVIKLFSDKEAYNRYNKLINKSALGEEANTIIKALGKWHSESVSTFSWPKFAAWFGLVLHSKMEASKMGVYKELFKKLDEDPEFDEANTHLLLHGLMKRDYASRIAEQSLLIADGSKADDLDTILPVIADYNKAVGNIDKLESCIVDSDITRLVSKLKTPGYKWRLECMNESLGELRKGDLVVISTRPDTGKTTMCASESTYMAGQMPNEKSVLWVNNEEEGGKVYGRIVQSALGITSEELEEDPAKAAASYTKLMGRMDKVIIFDKADVSTRDVDALLKKYDIGLIIFDQLWKMHGFEEEAGNEVTRQGMLFNWARELSKKYAPVIAVHQADGTAQGQRWIEMSQLYGSKTVIQGEADAIVTIGRDPATGDTRYLYVPKNKLKGKNPAMRNGKYELQILPHIGRFKEF